MDKVFDKVWSNCLEIIKDIVEWQHFKTWFEPIKPVALKDKVLTIQVPSQFFFEYLEEHYVTLLAKTLKRELGKEAHLEYRIMVDSGNSKNKPLTMDVTGQGYKTFSNNEMDFPLVINNPVKNPFVIPGLKKMQIDPQLNHIYTFDAFIEGGKNGWEVIIKIIPYLVGMLVAIRVFRDSGSLQVVIDGLAWIFNSIGINADFVAALPVAIMRPFSGGGARALMLDVFKAHGPDSFVGQLASIFQGSAESTFYILALYFGSVGIKKVRYAIWAGLITDIVAIVTAILIANIFFA
jgi:spore maturation protein SpmB